MSEQRLNVEDDESSDLLTQFDQLTKEATHYLATGNRDQAATLLDQAYTMVESIDDAVVKAIWLNTLALIQLRAGDVLGARDVLEEAVSLLKGEESPAELARIVKNLGFVERELGNLVIAAQHHQVALACLEEINDLEGVASVLIDLGIVYKDQRRLTEAKVSFERALALLPISVEPRSRGHALVGLGLTLGLLHRTTEAHDHYQQALIAYQLAGDRENEALTLHNLGGLAYNQDDFPTALHYYRQSLVINQEINLPLGIYEDLGALASIYQFTGQLEQARQQHLEVLEDFIRLNFRSGQLQTLIFVGIIDRDTGELAEAEATFSRALTLAHDMDEPAALYEVYSNRADVRLLAENFQAAGEDYKAAAFTIESLRTRLVSEMDTLAYFDQARLEVYDRLVRLYALVLDDTSQAFHWSEQSRSRTFLHRLRFSDFILPVRLDLALIVRERQILAQLRQVVDSLSISEEAERLALLTTYETLTSAIQALWEELAPKAPEYVALRRGEPMLWSALQECLRLD